MKRKIVYLLCYGISMAIVHGSESGKPSIKLSGDTAKMSTESSTPHAPRLDNNKKTSAFDGKDPFCEEGRTSFISGPFGLVSGKKPQGKGYKKKQKGYILLNKNLLIVALMFGQSIVSAALPGTPPRINLAKTIAQLDEELKAQRIAAKKQKQFAPMPAGSGKRLVFPKMHTGK